MHPTNVSGKGPLGWREEEKQAGAGACSQPATCCMSRAPCVLVHSAAKGKGPLLDRHIEQQQQQQQRWDFSRALIGQRPRASHALHADCEAFSWSPSVPACCCRVLFSSFLGQAARAPRPARRSRRWSGRARAGASSGPSRGTRCARHATVGSCLCTASENTPARAPARNALAGWSAAKALDICARRGGEAAAPSLSIPLRRQLCSPACSCASSSEHVLTGLRMLVVCCVAAADPAAQQPHVVLVCAGWQGVRCHRVSGPAPQGCGGYPGLCR